MKKVKNTKRLSWIWATFRAKMRGHIQYFSISFNTGNVSTFLVRAKEIVFKWLNRRSQKNSFTWDEFEQFMKQFPLPPVRVVHQLY
jgi:hypothetical protein